MTLTSDIRGFSASSSQTLTLICKDLAGANDNPVVKCSQVVEHKDFIV